jgi:hypothetical protein
VKVHDVTGAVVPNAQVSVTAASVSHETRLSQTKWDGLATYGLPEGDYQITVKSPGFLTYARSDVKLACRAEKAEGEAHVRLDAQLEVAAMYSMGVVVEVLQVAPVPETPLPRMAQPRILNLVSTEEEATAPAGSRGKGGSSIRRLWNDSIQRLRRTLRAT